MNEVNHAAFLGQVSGHHVFSRFTLHENLVLALIYSMIMCLSHTYFFSVLGHKSIALHWDNSDFYHVGAQLNKYRI